MRSKYRQRNSESRDSNDSNIIKYNFNYRFNISKEKSPKNIIPKNNIKESQKEIYKNKIISKIKKQNPNLKIIRQSSYSKFDNESNEYINNISKNNKEIKQRIKMLSINYIKKKKQRNSQQKNYSSSNIKDFDSPKNRLNTYTIGSESTSVTKKKKFEIKPYKSNKHFEINNDKITVEQNKENISININNNKNNIVPFSASSNNNNKNKIRASFKYLIHQAYKNKALSKSFSRFYKSSRSKEKENEQKKYTKNKIIKMNFIKKANSNLNKFSEINNSRNNIRTMNHLQNKNIFFTTSSNNNSFFAQKEKDNYIEDFELIYEYLNKIKKIIKKIDKFELIQDECYNCIQYYFTNSLNNKITNFFSDSSIIHYLQKELVIFFSCYDISFYITIFIYIIYHHFIIVIYIERIAF